MLVAQVVNPDPVTVGVDPHFERLLAEKTRLSERDDR
jgi:hypothetical protein